MLCVVEVFVKANDEEAFEQTRKTGIPWNVVPAPVPPIAASGCCLTVNDTLKPDSALFAPVLSSTLTKLYVFVPAVEVDPVNVAELPAPVETIVCGAPPLML